MAHILIIDDDDQFRGLLRETLQRAGYEITEAVNGLQGLRIFHEKPPDMVITDMLMPVMPGSRFISTLRSDFPDVKIIAISGGGKSYYPGSFLQYARELGARAVLEKPVSRVDLLKAIKDILQS